MKQLGSAKMLNLVAGVAVLGLASACVSGSGGSSAPEWLFMQAATGGGYEDGTLTLDGVDHTIAFTERPERKVANIGNGDFAASWEEGADSFAADPPNSVLAYEMDGNTGRAILQLNSIEAAGGKLTYAVEILEGDVPGAVFGRATLVIDADSTAVNQQITD